MSFPQEPNVGQRIRVLRDRHGFSIRALAERAGLSSNAISLIERGQNSPTVSTLHQLAMALNLPMTAFFEEEIEQLSVFVKRNQGLRYQGNGRVVESLGAGLLNQQLEALSIFIDPGAGSMDDPISHSGQEFIQCLEGQIEYYLDQQVYRMEAGDSLLFDATQRHCFRNVNQHPAQILIIFYAGNEQVVARERHLA